MLKNYSADTSEEIHNIVIQMYAALSNIDKLRKCSSFLTSAKRISRASIKEQMPQLDEIDLELAVFRRIYQHSLSEEIITKFEQHYRKLNDKRAS